MSTSDIFAGTDPRLRNFIRQYSDYLKQNNLENQFLTQSSHPAQMYNLSQANDFFVNAQARRGSDVRSLIEQLTKKQIRTATTNATNPVHVSVNPARPVLVNTEQRIFQQVINLLMEINDIKEAIQKEKDLTLQMEIERDNILNKGGSKAKGKKPGDFEMESIINKLKGKQGDELKISMAQLQKFSTENQQLQKSINRLKIKSKGNLKQVLEEQRQKYKNLKKKLEEKNNETVPAYSSTILTGSNPEVIQQLKRLQSDIQRLEMGVSDGSSVGAEIKRLNEQNQRLKQKVLTYINQSGPGGQQNEEQIEERRRLQQYIRQQQQNKKLFYEDLKKFKQQYDILREQNQELRKRLKNSRPNSQIGGSKVQSNANKGRYGADSRLGQYQDLMNEMTTVMK